MLDEAASLARAIDLDIQGAEIVALSRVKPSTLLGNGVVERLAERIARERIAVVVINGTLSPVQQRNLQCSKLHDRTPILKFSLAREPWKVVQVELAALNYARSWLVRP